MFLRNLALSVCLFVSAFSQAAQLTFMEKTYNFGRSIYEEAIEPFSNLFTTVPNLAGAVVKRVPQGICDQMPREQKEQFLKMKKMLFNWGIGQNFDKAQKVGENTPWPEFGWNEGRKAIKYGLGLALDYFVFPRIAERKNSQMLKVLLNCSNIAAAVNFLVALPGYFSKNKRAEACIRSLNSVNTVVDCILTNNFKLYLNRRFGNKNITNLIISLYTVGLPRVLFSIFDKCLNLTEKAASAIKFMQGSDDQKLENEQYADKLKTSALCWELATSSYLTLCGLALFHSFWMPYVKKGLNIVKDQGSSLISHLSGQSV